MVVKTMKQTKINPKRHVIHVERLVLSEKKEGSIKSGGRQQNAYVWQ